MMSINLIPFLTLIVITCGLPIDRPATDLLTPFPALPIPPSAVQQRSLGSGDYDKRVNNQQQTFIGTGSKYNQDKKSGSSTASSKNYNSNSASKSSYSGNDGGAKILNQDQIIKGDGHYEYSFETDNGIHVHEVGDLKQIAGGEAAQDVHGSYSYTAPDGQLISLSYTADESGFHPVGDHIPTPPPIPVEIQRLLAYLEAHPEQNQK